MKNPNNQTLNRDFLDLLELLNEEGVRYLIIGGYAVGAYGYARATKDIDIWIDATDENAHSVLVALNRFGHTLQNLTVDDLKNPDNIVQIGLPPRRIDILPAAKGLVFSVAWEKRNKLSLGEVPLFVIGIKDLIKNKQMVNRKRDQEDVKQLKKRIIRPPAS